ncbi:MAG: hypothetical protein ACKVWV_18990 [Planctomycetota bacterium]
MRSIAAALCAIALATTSLSFARPSTPQAPQATPQERRAPAQDASDPTELDLDLRRRLDPRATPAAPDASPIAPLPTIVLRGLVVAVGGKGAAMIQVGDALYHVDANSVVSARGATGTAHTLRVRSIGADEVVLEAETTGDTIVLR